VTDLQELKTQIQNASGGQNPADHVLARIVAFLPGPTIFVDADVPVHGATDPGKVFVVSGSRVLLATFKNAAGVDSTDNPNRSSVEVTTWRRSDLRRISLEGDLDGRNSALDGRNSDLGWRSAAGGAWPSGAVVTLLYKDDQTVRLPMRKDPSDSQLAAVRSITQELLADLA